MSRIRSIEIKCDLCNKLIGTLELTDKKLINKWMVQEGHVVSKYGDFCNTDCVYKFKRSIGQVCRERKSK